MKAQSRLLVLTDAEKGEAHALARKIFESGGSVTLWEQAARSPAFAAAVHAALYPAPSCAMSAEEFLELFYRYGDSGLPVGGRLWLRPARALDSKRRLKRRVG